MTRTALLPGLSQCSSAAFRVAVLTASFHDCLLSGAPGGLLSLSQRLLKAQGFKVLTVGFKTFMPHQNKLDRVKQLESILQQLLTST